ncbi:MAG: hypothetical protein NC091_13990 [Bacteroides sp.]|nr:hypothetical protein [Bacteroides sp.]
MAEEAHLFTCPENVKVHFAGTEQPDFVLCANAAGVKYYLFTVFPFICRKMGIKGFTLIHKTHCFSPDAIASFSTHSIMDSGLFTLMFGAEKGDRSEAFLLDWMDALCDFVKTHSIKSTCVEIDCQRILGVEQAWKFRERLREKLPNNRQINVFHLPDGRNGLDRLIEFSDYIAISVPEWRMCRPKDFAKGVHRTACYIKNRKPEIDIHLLGCTDVKLLKNCRFCTSADSTSWLMSVRTNRIKKHHVSTLNRDFKRRFVEMAGCVLDTLKVEKRTERTIAYITHAIISAYLSKKEYARAVGGQE